MTPYFADPARVDQLHAALRDRFGCRFAEAGGRCVEWVVAVLAACGLPMDVLRDAPSMPLSFGRFHASERSPLMHFLETQPELRAHLHVIATADGLMPGDLVPIRVRAAVPHLGIAEGDERVWHCPRHGGFGPVSVVMLRQQKHLHQTAFRIVDVL